MPENLAIAVFVLGAILILIAILGGNFKLFGAEVASIVTNPFLRFVSFALGIALLAIALKPLLQDTNPKPPTNGSTPTPTFTRTATPTPIDRQTPTPAQDSGNDIVSVAGCVLTIDNPLVPLRKEPDPFGQEIIKLKPGRYEPLGYTTTTFNRRDRGWYQIRAEGRTGWIADDTWTIGSKTSQCP
jgi:hypothetical protein